MVIVVNSLDALLKEKGFSATNHGVYLKPALGDQLNGELSYWAVATLQGDETSFSLGVVAPKVNSFALSLLKRCSEGRIKPQFPAYVGPPIFIAETITAKTTDIPFEASELISNFFERFGRNSIDDWFRMAGDLMPYAPSQVVLMPAYYYMKRDRKALLEYLAKKHLAHPASDVEQYLDKLGEMASNIEHGNANATGLQQDSGDSIPN
jgi:hypothetical protein